MRDLIQYMLFLGAKERFIKEINTIRQYRNTDNTTLYIQNKHSLTFLIFNILHVKKGLKCVIMLKMAFFYCVASVSKPNNIRLYGGDKIN